MILVVCPLKHLLAIVAERAPSHAVSLGSPGHELPSLPNDVAHLALAMNDIAAPRPGLADPSREAVAELLRFGRGWGGERPMVVHCQLGISRSTAAAFALACQAAPNVPEREIAAALRRAAPCATPNPLVVALADSLLERGGRMVAAAEAIGRGADYAPYRSFDLAPFAVRAGVAA